MADGLEVAEEGDIPIGRATIIEIGAGRRLRIINHLGQQVVDTWVFVASRTDEFLSMEHCRAKLYKLFFGPDDTLISNLRRPLVRIAADTSPGRHDTLCSACDADSYAEYGQGTNHPNCRANFLAAFSSRGINVGVVPCPWNLFVDISVTPDGSLSDRPSAARAGDYVEIEALTDVWVVCSPLLRADRSPSQVWRKQRCRRQQQFPQS